MTEISSPLRRTRRHRGRRGRAETPLHAQPVALEAPERAPPFELDSLAAQWQRALDAGDRALVAAGGSLPAAELAAWRRELARERLQTGALLVAVGKASGVASPPWLPPAQVTPQMLGLAASTGACLFDLEGVLTDSGLLHAWAWGEVFDAFLLQSSEETGWQFVPFDRGSDYRTYIEGRSRLEGIDTFLASRGIRVPEGRPSDAPEARTAWGLAKRKGETIARALRQRGVTALPDARRYLEAAGHAGLRRAALSASSSTLPMLRLAGLATLVEARLDAEAIREEELRTPPAPDLMLAACRRLGVPPERTVAFTHRPAGVAAALAAGVAVVGVGDGSEEDLLRGFGAERVLPSLGAALDRRLLDGSGTHGRTVSTKEE